MVWYVADNDRQMAAVDMNMEKAIKSAEVILEYLLTKYCWINHSPSKKITAGMR